MPPALEAITSCLDAARSAAEAAGGRVVKTTRDEVMCIFPPRRRSRRPAEMQGRVGTLPEVDGTKLGMHIGMHTARCSSATNDVFGDTVNLAAAWVAGEEGRDHHLHDTAALLGPMSQHGARAARVTVKGKARSRARGARLEARRRRTVFARPRAGRAKPGARCA